jgi:penicillin-binding protein 1A
MPTLPRLRLRARTFGIVALFLAAALFGTASGVLFAFIGDLPQISALDDYSPGTITRVLGRDGSVVGEFANERRQLLTYEQIPEVLRHAIIAVEDGKFESHGGLRIGRIVVTLVKDIVYRRSWGGSTITQQLAKKLFLTDDKTPERKIKEALLTIQIEKRYTKAEILTMYCNQMPFGHRTYGVEAAAQLYFAKSAKDLTLEEAAMIAGIIQGPARQNPYVNMNLARDRRNYTLDRMATEGFITRAVADATKKLPIVVRGAPRPAPSIAPYFLEAIRLHLEEQYTAKKVFEGGLEVKTGLDPGLQRAANKAMDSALRELDKKRGWRKPAENVLAKGRTLANYRDPHWTRYPGDGDIAWAVVTSTQGNVIHLRLDKWTGTIDAKGFAWTKRRADQRADQIVQDGDLVEVRIVKANPGAGTFTGLLEQPPLIEGAVLAIDNHTGQILAMIGGSNFERSQFNRATQALRQVGSLFKPFVYMAAVDRGYTVATTIEDTQASFFAGPNQPPYEPQNYDREFKGTITLRQALEQSRNVPAVRLMEALTPPEVIKYARRFGISTPLPEYLSVAIGSAEGSLLEMTSAYSALPNQGVRMTPMLLTEVTDRNGDTLEQHRSEPHQALRADTAFIITNLLEGVVSHGTAATAAKLNWPLGGKTGTTDDYSDAWFIGFDRDITLGVWIGFDQKRSLGERQTGSAIALPVWTEIMESWVSRRRAELGEPPQFERPGNVVIVQTATGPEVFIVGTEPIGKRPN